MFEKTLQSLGAQGYEVQWRYEIITNSIIVRMEKRHNHQWWRRECRIKYEDIGMSGGFELTMIIFLKRMAMEMERDMKGE